RGEAEVLCGRRLWLSDLQKISRTVASAKNRELEVQKLCFLVFSPTEGLQRRLASKCTCL
ncbi:mCG1047170, partial [Mus musculus]